MKYWKTTDSGGAYYFVLAETPEEAKEYTEEEIANLDDDSISVISTKEIDGTKQKFEDEASGASVSMKECHDLYNLSGVIACSEW